MDFHVLYAWGALALLVVATLFTVAVAHYGFWRWQVRRRRQTSRYRSKIYPACLALGMAFLQFVRIFYQPTAAYLLEAKEEKDVDEDDSGDPESPASKLKHFHRQLRKIRRHEPIDRLVWRL